ncbi:ABC transporter permease [Segnochrobactrum spirostomi]|uniref:ABC transporter permease n=1 Tax=Segnochrobactrum spirostomi TaxID=2608987 RepID=A0A6A7Y9U2_9HYPH|nr:ABC transporter permease [Segnochrobactrum spirostomi]MQT14731.1 ABC transporter permease [Segnochrobactrum spirostomi]
MAPTSASAAGRRPFGRGTWRFAGLSVAAASLLLMAVAGLSTPSFLTVGNGLVIVRAASMTGIVAVAMSFVTLSGNLFALSASALGAFLAVVFALVTAAAGLGAGLGAVLVVAVAAGALQGVAVNLTGNPIIATLAFGAVFRGLASVLSGNGVLRINDAAATWIGTARPLGIPTQSWAFVILAALAWLTVRKTSLGRRILLSGANREAAVASGLRVAAVTGTALAILSVGAAIVAVFTVCQFSEARANLFNGYDFDYIAAVLVGGIALRGGQGSPLQAALGAVLIALLENLMLLNGFSAGLRMTIVGAVVVGATSAFHLLQDKT